MNISDLYYSASFSAAKARRRLCTKSMLAVIYKLSTSTLSGGKFFHPISRSTAAAEPLKCRIQNIIDFAIQFANFSSASSPKSLMYPPGLSMLTVFQCITASGWSHVMYRVMDYSTSFSCIFFIIAVVVGNYFLLNLFLAVLKLKFAKAQQELLSS